MTAHNACIDPVCVHVCVHVCVCVGVGVHMTGMYILYVSTPVIKAFDIVFELEVDYSDQDGEENHDDYLEEEVEATTRQLTAMHVLTQVCQDPWS